MAVNIEAEHNLAVNIPKEDIFIVNIQELMDNTQEDIVMVVEVDTSLVDKMDISLMDNYLD